MMNCPKDGTALLQKSYKGIDVDFCPSCSGMWLDLEELDQLEDTIFSDDEYKGALIFSDQAVSFRCPHCGNSLRQFKYRLYDLTLEYCPEKHGFWLDADEDKRVVELMQRRIKDLQRKFDAEAEWAKTLKRLRSRSFTARLKDLFK